MLTEFQKAKLVEWAEWRINHRTFSDKMPRGLSQISTWLFDSGRLRGITPFPTFDTETPYTFGDADG